MNKKLLLLSYTLFLFTGSVFCQRFLEKTNVGFGGGISGYHGSMPQTFTKAAGAINIDYELSDHIRIRFQAMASETGGSDSALNNIANLGDDTRSSFYYFHTNINELSLLGEYDIFSLGDGALITPYILAGMGLYNFKPYQIVQVDRPDGSFRYENLVMQKVAGYGNWQISLPVGIGARYALSANTTLHAEANYRFLFNPYIDNYAADGKNDRYYTFSIGFSFRLSPVNGASGSRQSSRNCKCPPVY